MDATVRDCATDSPFRLWKKHTLLGNIIGSFKSLAFRRYYNYLKGNDLLMRQTATIWQRNYWERIIRDKQELERIRQYIINNPAKWANDSNNLERLLDRIEEKKCS